MPNSNPFVVTNAIDSMINTQQGLASVGKTDADTAYILQHAELAKQQADAAKQKAAQGKASSEALMGLATTASPFGGLSDIGSSPDKTPFLDPVEGKAPLGLKMFAAAMDFDRKARATQGVGDVSTSLKFAKERDALLEKAALQQNKDWAELQKQVKDMDTLVAGVEGAPSYNAMAEQARARFGPNALKKFKLPESITQEQYESDPTIQDKVALTQRQLAGSKTMLDNAQKQMDRDFKEGQEARRQEHERWAQRNGDNHVAIARDGLTIRKKELEVRTEDKAMLREERVVSRAQNTLLRDQNYKNADLYNNAKGKMDEMSALMYDDKGLERSGWWKNLKTSDAQALQANVNKIITDFKDTTSTVYGDKRSKEVMGNLQKASSYLGSLGEGSKQYDRKTWLEMNGTLNKAYNIFNTNLVRHEAKVLQSVEAGNGDIDRIVTKGNYADFFRRNYDKSDPNSYVSVAEKKEDDGSSSYWMVVGQDPPERIAKKVYDYANR